MVSGTEGAGHESRRVLWLSYLSGAFGLAMFTQGNFLVALRARELGATLDVIGLIIGAGSLAAAISSVPSGALIDRLGPRRTFIIGTAATSLASLLYVFATDYRWFLALQPLLGIARGVGWVSSQSYISSIGTAKERPKLTGRFSFFSNLGQMAGPVLAGAAAELVGLRWAMLVPAVYAVCFTFLGLRMKDIRTRDHDATPAAHGAGVRSAMQLVAIRGIQVALLLTFARLWITNIYSTFLPVFLVDGGMEPALVGTIIATSGLVAALMAPTTGFWTRFGSQQTVAVLGLACGAAALVLTPHVAVVPIVFLVPTLIGIGVGLSLPLLISIVTTAAPAHKRGVALGLRDMVNQSAATIAPVVVGPLITALGMALGFTTGGVVGGALLVAARLTHTLDRREQAAGR